MDYCSLTSQEVNSIKNQNPIKLVLMDRSIVIGQFKFTEIFTRYILGFSLIVLGFLSLSIHLEHDGRKPTLFADELM